MSKGLEALEELKESCKTHMGTMVYILQEDKFETIEEELKALEIIKNKEVNVFIFLHSGDLETYNDMVEDNRKLTQEEYDLIRSMIWIKF